MSRGETFFLCEDKKIHNSDRTIKNVNKIISDKAEAPTKKVDILFSFSLIEGTAKNTIWQ